MAVLGFRSGALGSIIGTSAVCSAREGIRALVHGQKGTVVTANDRLERWEFGDSAEGPELKVIPKTPLGDMIDSIENDRKPFVDGTEGRKSLEIVLALYESARTGETVKLPVPSRQPASLTGI
ncbi:MAG: hypothetical protein GWP14_11175 [Actinobacteria bacterium]|nr:hypothetical protein [Actinomycetota bacterium]